ncbi:Extracellular exo-alpha-(1-_5)-L-arabinofuranosidase ArbA [Flavobacterium sp. 9R]|uniref:arabinan endo-1,5-alpha-L-arabinosidase n=1 Tax=Flavobacterium sp. 9R TaxID=2653143 RepID=UPI0012EFEB4D|nr:arabinan endo-1,5-alpha-L-arabinosidase [Flavobacterium sp. 9R]VXB20750.1 Extracellular exo-alpha-(1->5)-L-arabinofuranosidase ArbA [Flavobacterium sp. 9R]
MKFYKKIATSLVLLMTIVSLAQNNMVHDPVVIKQKDTYYLYCTGKGISVLSSKDLKNWQPEPSIFKEKPHWVDVVVPNFDNHIWAPDISFHNNTYYLYYSVSAFAKNTSAIGVATNTTLNPKDPAYKWIDHGIVIQSQPNRDMWNPIDPNLVFDDSNTPWLTFGSFWEGLKMVKLNPDLKSIANPQEWHTIAKRKRSFDLPDTDPGDAALEAPFIFKKKGYYYLFLSWDLCCRGDKSTYKVVVGRSKNPTGPYVDKTGKSLNEGGGSLVVEGNENYFGVGHNSVYTFDNKDYIFYHGYEKKSNGAPKLIIKELLWDTENWPSLK